MRILLVYGATKTIHITKLSFGFSIKHEVGNKIIQFQESNYSRYSYFDEYNSVACKYLSLRKAQFSGADFYYLTNLILVDIAYS